MHWKKAHWRKTYLMRNTLFFILFVVLISCNDTNENVMEQNRIIRQRFDSIDRKLDSFNKKMQQGADSAIRNIDSLLLELGKKKKK